MMTSVETRSISALWYAWGQIDSGNFPTLTLDDGFEFQRQQTEAAEEYYTHQRTHFMDSILKAWADYLASKVPATPPTERQSP